MSRTAVSIIVSVYNEEAALPLFLAEARRVLPGIDAEFRLLFVNDGSRDRSLELIREYAAGDSRISYLSFSRNYGHEAAMLAGIDYADGDLMICMDADLQHPLTCIPEILKQYEAGYDVINMVRRSNKDAGRFKNITSEAFYRLINLISDTHLENGASDYFAVSRRAAQVLRREYRERNRFIRGFIQNIGFRRTTCSYDAADRSAGESKYSIRKLVRFSINTIVCFSDLPLRFGLYAGAAAGLCSLIAFIAFLADWIRSGAPDGIRGIVWLILLMSSLTFFLLGVLGTYLAVLQAEVKGRPIYIVEETGNLHSGPAESAKLPGKAEGVPGDRTEGPGHADHMPE